MLHKRFIAIIKLSTSFSSVKLFNHLPLINKGLTVLLQKPLTSRPRFCFSSFKDEYNEPADEQGILKEFEVLIERFQVAYDAGRFEEAREQLEQSAQLMRRVNCQNSIQFVEIMLNIVATCKKYGEAHRVLSALEEAEAALSHLPEGNYTHKQIVYSHLSYEYDLRKDHAKTIDYLTKLLQIFQQTDIESLEVAQINQKVGELFLEQNKLEEAAPFFGRALQVLENKNQTKRREYLKILDDLSYIYFNQEKYDRVLELRLKALPLEEALSGKQSLPYVSHLKNIALIYKRLKQAAKYEEFMEKALEASHQLEDQSTPIINEIKQNLGIFYFHTAQQFEKALPLLEAALPALALHGDEAKHIYFLRAIAECHKNLKDYEPSRLRFLEVVTILEKREEKGCEYAYLLSEVGMAYYNLEKYAEALQYYLRSLAIEEQKHGHESQTCIQLYENIAELYYLLGDQLKSQEYSSKADKYKPNAAKHH